MDLFHPTFGVRPHDVPLLIDGCEEAATSGRTFALTSPLDGKLVTNAAAASTEDARRAASRAAAAFPVWSEYEPHRRRQILMRAADLLDSHSTAICRIMIEETGATQNWANFNVQMGGQFLRDAASAVSRIVGEVAPGSIRSSWSMVNRVPAGVVLGMAPWNAPLLLGIRAIAMPLACGNTVILKSSELCPATHLLIGRLMLEAGLPAGALNVVSNDLRDAEIVVEEIIAHPAVRRVNFTGSTRVGRIIAASCARHLKRCLLELGGKSPMIVLDDADLQAAADAAVFGAFANQGQACMSTERLLVDDAMADDFIDLMIRRIQRLTDGARGKLADQLGCMINDDACKRAQSLVIDATVRGARVVIGGQTHGLTMEPTLIDCVDHSMRIYHEESFAPILPIIRFKTIDEAITIANDTDYGLAAAIFTTNISEAIRISRRLETGIVQINGPTIHDEAHIPFGGTKASGYGRFGGLAGIEEFTEHRWISVHEDYQKHDF